MREDSKPQLSVVIPWYRSTHLARTIAPLVDHFTPTDLEVIVVDDDSGTELPSDARELLLTRTNCQVLHLNRNSGPGAARNAGLKASTGTYVAFHDADDVPNAQSLQEACLLMASAGADVGFSAIASERPMRMTERLAAKWRPGQIHEPLSEAISVHPAVWRYVFRRSWLNREDLWFPEMRYGEDLIFLVQVLKRSPLTVQIPSPVMLYMNLSSSGDGAHTLEDEMTKLELLRALLVVRQQTNSAELSAVLDWWMWRIWIALTRTSGLSRRTFAYLEHLPWRARWLPSGWRIRSSQQE